MSFTEKFEEEKPLRESPYSLSEKVGPHELRYHPKRKRWSCGCLDWQYRRSAKGDDVAMEEKNCKHIKGRILGKSHHEIRAHDIANGSKPKSDKNPIWRTISGFFR
jgi:hypothetical protein